MTTTTEVQKTETGNLPSVLMIWECLGGGIETRVFFFDQTFPYLEKLQSCSNLYINSDSIPKNHFIWKVNAAIEGPDPDDEDEVIFYDAAWEVSLGEISFIDEEIFIMKCGYVA